jgi:hypothetical protein
MGVLDNTTITVDAILTKKGRELLAQGEGKFKITKFALADDEIDYGLYDITHPNGSNFYGQAIESMNLLEAIPNQTLAVKYFLNNNVNQTSGTAPIITLTGASTIQAGKSSVYTAETDNAAGELYEFVLGSIQYATIVTTSQENRSVPQVEQETGFPGDGLGGGGGYTGTGGGGNPSGTTSTIGTSVTIKCRPTAILGSQDRQVVLTARGLQTGKLDSLTINLTRT